MTRLATASLCLLLAACGSSEPTTAGRPVTAESTHSPSSELAATAEPVQAVPAAGGTVCAPDMAFAKRTGDVMALVSLEHEGFSIVVPGSGCLRMHPFGSRADVAVSELVQAFEMAQAPAAVGDECGGAVYSFDYRMLLHARDGAFLGWSLQDGSRLATADGIGLGTTRETLAKAHGIDILEESTLGDEFSFGGIAGLFASGAQDAKITHLWAGELCIAR
jgi:hypothetical protein